VGDPGGADHVFHIRVAAAIQGKMAEKSKQIGVLGRGQEGISGSWGVFWASLFHYLSSLPEKFVSRLVMHGKACLVYGIFLVYFVVKEKVRAVEADVVQSAVGGDDSLGLGRQVFVHIPAKAVVGVSSRHVRTTLRPDL
jgi:hypothetical protein